MESKDKHYEIDDIFYIWARGVEVLVCFTSGHMGFIRGTKKKGNSGINVLFIMNWPGRELIELLSIETFVWSLPSVYVPHLSGGDGMFSMFCIYSLHFIFVQVTLVTSTCARTCTTWVTSDPLVDKRRIAATPLPCHLTKTTQPGSIRWIRKKSAKTAFS